MKRTFFLTIYYTLFLIITGCSDPAGLNKNEQVSSANKSISIFVTIPPQKGIIKAIAGKYVCVKVMVSPGKNPHDYQPTPKQILALHNAKAYFEIGIPFEKTLIQKLKEVDTKINFVDMCNNTKQLVYYVNDKVVIDPHIWMSPVQLEVLCKNTLSALIKLMPQHAAYFKNNYNKYIKKLNKINKELKETLAPFKGETFFIFHPALGYFAADFGLKQEAVEVEGKEPTPKELFNLISRAKKAGIKVIFVEPQFSKKSAQVLAEAIHGSVIPINPLSENVLDNFQIIAEKIKSSFLKTKSRE